ncbi:MAG: thioesterase family protein [Burkholderiaceae bacterium]
MTPLDPASVACPFETHLPAVLPEWIDYNGHMNVGYYHVAFDTASEAFFHYLGLTPGFREANGSTTFALEAHLNFLRELKQGDPLRFECRLLDYDHKRIHFYQEMFHGTEGYLAASHESVSAHVAFAIRRTAPMPGELLDRLAIIKAAHAGLERPWQVGHVMSAHPPKKS